MASLHGLDRPGFLDLDIDIRVKVKGTHLLVLFDPESEYAEIQSDPMCPDRQRVSFTLSSVQNLIDALESIIV